METQIKIPAEDVSNAPQVRNAPEKKPDKRIIAAFAAMGAVIRRQTSS